MALSSQAWGPRVRRDSRVMSRESIERMLSEGAVDVIAAAKVCNLSGVMYGRVSVRAGGGAVKVVRPALRVLGPRRLRGRPQPLIWEFSG